MDPARPNENQHGTGLVARLPVSEAYVRFCQCRHWRERPFQLSQSASPGASPVRLRATVFGRAGRRRRQTKSTPAALFAASEARLGG